MTIDRPGRDWRVIIEQGNGDVIKMLDLTDIERVNLSLMLDFESGGSPPMDAVSFTDFTR